MRFPKKNTHLYRQQNPIQQTFMHPQTNDEVSLSKNIGIYAWHSQHHYAHIENLMIRNKWH
jgi:hydrogenase maturation factor HypF (carbamoyltransferase family)